MGEFIVAFIVGILAGVGLMILYIAYKFKAIIKEIDQYIEKATDSVLLGIRVEKYGEYYRFYRAEDNQFICQTTTLDNIREVFGKQFPTKTCYIEDGEPDVVEELKQALKK